MQFLLMTTTDMASDRSTAFARLIASVAEALPAGSRHVFLLQRCTEEQRREAVARIPYPATVLCSPDRMSLSAARNVMLAHARGEGLLASDTIVAYPDDDCWYPHGLLPSVLAAFRDRADLGLLLVRVSLAPSLTWNRDAERIAGTAHVLRRSSSNGMFLRGDVAAAVGDFDPSLGLGTPAGSGEDTDYALRAWFAAPRTIYIDQALVGHHDGDITTRSRYFRGNMLVAGHYAVRSPALFYEFVRKFGVGACMVATKHLKMGDYLTAIQTSLRAVGKSTG